MSRTGIDCEMNRNSGTWAIPVGVAVGDIRDAEIDQTWNMAEFKKRVTREVLTKPTTVNRVVTGVFEHDPGDTLSDANFAAFKDAFEARTQLELFILDGPFGTSGNQGLRAHFYVSKWSRSESLEDVVVYNFEVRLAVDYNAAEVPVWYVVA